MRSSHARFWAFVATVAFLLAPPRFVRADAPTTAPADEFFTVVALPDTQFYSKTYPDTFMKQTAWIRDNVKAEHIVFVTELGDIVDGNEPAQWEVADKAMAQLDGAVPWGVTIGNHDFDKSRDATRPATAFVKHFGPERFKGQPWYGGASENGLSSYQIIEAGGTKLMFIQLEIAAPQAAWDWAKSALARNPDVQAIVSTHIYLASKGRDKDAVAYLGKEGHSGEQTWQNLISTSPQIFMVLCGHLDSNQFRQTSTNEAGGQVHELLSDFQGHKNGGNGYLRLMRFVPAKKEIQVRTYSPTADEYLTDPADQFTLPWEPKLAAKP